MAYPAVTDIFISLLLQPKEISPEALQKIERFVILMYSKTSTLSRVNEARQELFAQYGRSIDNIPPTQGALLQHIKRTVLQGGYIWGQALNTSPDIPSPGDWGYKRTASGSGWIPHWTDLEDATRSCKELVRCKCQQTCKSRCKCRSLNLPCTELCKFCGGDCDD